VHSASTVRHCRRLARLAAIINSRLAAESRIANAISFVWLCGGWAICCCLIGAGAALAFWGYTVFNTATFGSGTVVTGWSFDLSDTTRPTYQRCYYEQTLDKGIAATQTVAIDASPRRPSALTKLSFDFDGALANCIWFSGT
jgi:hypothetical protein